MPMASTYHDDYDMDRKGSKSQPCANVASKMPKLKGRCWKVLLSLLKKMEHLKIDGYLKPILDLFSDGISSGAFAVTLRKGRRLRRGNRLIDIKAVAFNQSICSSIEQNADTTKGKMQYPQNPRGLL